MFERPIRIVDVVRAECLRYPGRLGHDALAAWFQQIDGERIDVIKTPFLAMWNDAVAKEVAGDTTFPSRQIGDATQTFVMSGMARMKPSSEKILLLLEDAAFGDGVVRNTHPSVFALSTRAFLTTLENYGIITSAAAILQEVADAGRKVAPYRAERPGRLDVGARSEWTSALKPPGS